MEQNTSIFSHSPEYLQLAGTHVQAMLAHVSGAVPEEACGLLGGHYDGQMVQIQAVLPIENSLHSPTRFRMEPLQQLQAFQWLEERGYELVGIYHSHPTGPDHPSNTDLAEFAYPGTLQVIWSPNADGRNWTMNCFSIQGNQVCSIRIEQSEEG